MDEKLEYTSIADDANDPDNDEKELKEKSELIYEIKTICELDSLVSHCGIIKNKPLMLATQDYSKECDKNFLNISLQDNANLQSEGNINESNLVILDHSQISQETSNPEQMPDIRKKYENILGESHSQRTNPDIDKKLTAEKETKALTFEQMAEIIDYSDIPCNEEKIQMQQEYQLCIDSSDYNLLDDSKRSSRRNTKRKKDFDGYCPICGVTVRLNDLESHYNQEVERLSKISRCSKKIHLEEVQKSEAFDLVKKNRENRLTARVARYSARAKSEVKCPVCSLRMSGTAEEINKHVAFCIQDEDSDVNVDGDDEEWTDFEEYEIGDETRIRPISLVPGGYRSLHGDSVRRTAEDEDLNVDIDDTIAYGDPQYSEIDVIPNASSEKDRLDLEQLRKAVALDSSARAQNVECHKWSKTVESEADGTEVQKNMINSDPVVSSLKEKIKALEDQDKSVRCLICLESYTKPVVSTTCWHVHCEECWLMTMGVKKLCPQCNMIVFPSDLRKIYL